MRLWNLLSVSVFLFRTNFSTPIDVLASDSTWTSSKLSQSDWLQSPLNCATVSWTDLTSGLMNTFDARVPAIITKAVSAPRIISNRSTFLHTFGNSTVHLASSRQHAMNTPGTQVSLQEFAVQVMRSHTTLMEPPTAHGPSSVCRLLDSGGYLITNSLMLAVLAVLPPMLCCASTPWTK